MSIPKRVLERGKELSTEMLLYGVRFDQMTRKELIAVAAIGWHSYNELLNFGDNKSCHSTK